MCTGLGRATYTSHDRPMQTTHCRPIIPASVRLGASGRLESSGQLDSEEDAVEGLDMNFLRDLSPRLRVGQSERGIWCSPL
jgi:hypothetical protein